MTKTKIVAAYLSDHFYYHFLILKETSASNIIRVIWYKTLVHKSIFTAFYQAIYIRQCHSINKRDIFVKKVKWFFFRIFFFDKYKLCIIWSWFRAKVFGISLKFISWGSLKGWQIRELQAGTEVCHQIFVAEKCKQWKICRKCDVYKKVCYHIYPNPPLGQDMTQGHILSRV